VNTTCTIRAQINTAISNAARATLSTATDVNEDTVLFGAASEFDSLTLVSFITEVEQQINDTLRTEITIVDEKAMSQKRSPLRTIGTLADYVYKLVSEQPGLIA
jgi:acyl carrier protein